MGVRVGSYADLCVAKHLLHYFQFSAFPQHIRRASMATVVEANMLEARTKHASLTGRSL